MTKTTADLIQDLVLLKDALAKRYDKAFNDGDYLNERVLKIQLDELSISEIRLRQRALAELDAAIQAGGLQQQIDALCASLTRVKDRTKAETAAATEVAAVLEAVHTILPKLLPKKP
jgi:hypothetical protein